MLEWVWLRYTIIAATFDLFFCDFYLQTQSPHSTAQPISHSRYYQLPLLPIHPWHNILVFWYLNEQKMVVEILVCTTTTDQMNQILIVIQVISWGLWHAKKFIHHFTVVSFTMGKSLFKPVGIWTLCQIGFKAHCTSWGLDLSTCG